MLNDFQAESLKDYKQDPSKMNLTLFVMTINPAFKLNKESTPIVKALIDKYDESALRTKAILNFLQPVSVPLSNTQDIVERLKETKEKGTELDKKTEASYYNVSNNSNNERKLDIFHSLFGDEKVLGTLANSLISNEKPVERWSFSDNERANRRDFSNKTIMQPELVLGWTEELLGYEVVNFYDVYINKIFLPGNLSNYIFKKNNAKAFHAYERGLQRL
jgi:hypothetical protein